MQDQSFAAESTQFYPFAFLNSNKHGTHKVYTATQKNTNRFFLVFPPPPKQIRASHVYNVSWMLVRHTTLSGNSRRGAADNSQPEAQLHDAGPHASKNSFSRGSVSHRGKNVKLNRAHSEIWALCFCEQQFWHSQPRCSK